MTSREIVTKCLTFDLPERIPRDLWLLPWAEIHHPEAVKQLLERFPPDFTGSGYTYPPSEAVKGDQYEIGEYTDEWGCVFQNLQAGIIGEVKNPVVVDISDWRHVKPPYEQLPVSSQKACDIISRNYEKTDKFVIADCCPRPWERYQFLRGSMNALMDVMAPEKGFQDLLNVIHEFYLSELEFWIKTDVDAINFMDDWGSQNQLLIPPAIWRDIFKPLYREYCDIAHSCDKFIFMHSDGFISEIYPDLVEIGVDALNSQIFCMDFADVEKAAKGKIAFWGEIDRQHILPHKNPQVGRDAVRKVASHLYDPSGGLIAQFELGPYANPDTAFAIFEEWEIVSAGG